MPSRPAHLPLRILTASACIPAFLAAFALAAHCTELRLASWNINNLHAVSGEPLRYNAPVRSDEDFTILARYGKQLDADIVALQEIGSPEAVWRVFSPDDYELYFSKRAGEPVGSHRSQRDIFTALLVRKGIAVERVEELEGLEIRVDFGSTPTWTRRGIAVLVNIKGKRLWVVNVHLKSSCHGRSLEPSGDIDCDVLREQRDVLEDWIDRTFASSIPFVVMGDFNRRFDLHMDRDHFWRDLDDDDPRGLELMRLPYRRPSGCGEHAGDDPIDFFVFDPSAWRHVDRGSFSELVYSPGDLALGNRMSDHCPISVDLDLR